MKTRRLLTCGVIGGPLFVVTFLIEGFTRADYDWLRVPVSSLALGDLGWIQVVNFVITGLLMLAFAIGLWRALPTPEGSTWGPLLIAALGIGLVGAGIFVTDPVRGYPPGTPDQYLQYSLHGHLHELFSSPFFIGLPVACFVFTRRFAKWGERGWAVYSVMSGLTFLAFFVLTSMSLNYALGLAEFSGLFQRVSIIVGFGWLTSLAIHFLRAGESEFAQGPARD